MKILEGFNPKVMFKGGVIWGIFWLNLHFLLKVSIFLEIFWYFRPFLSMTLVLAINLAKIINSVLFYIKIHIFWGNSPTFLARKSSFFSSKLEFLANLY